MKLKKLLSVALATAMVATMLTACGGSNNSGAAAPADDTTAATTDTTTTDDTTAPADTAATGEKVVISVYRDTFNLASPDSAQVAAVQDAINEYIADKINVEIKLTDIGSGEYADKANLALSNGEINLLWTASWIDTINCDNLVKQNAVYDITDLVEANAALKGSMPQGIWDASSYDGKTYYVSCYKESAEGYDVMFRKDLVDKYGWDLSTIKTYKDIEPMLEDCKAEGLKYPYLTQKTNMFYRYGIDDFDFFMQNSMIAVERATDSVVCTLGTDQYKDFCTTMCEWAEKGYLSEDDATKTTTDTTTQTQDWGVSWWTDIPSNLEANNRYGQEVVMAKVTDNWAHSTTTLGSCFAVSSVCTDEQAKACVDFLGLMYTDSTLADLYTYGIEGQDYERDATGAVVKTDAGKYNHSAWESGNVEVISLEAGEPADKVQLYSTFNNGSKTSSAAGFRFDKTNVEAQWAACLTVFDQYGFVLENGGYAASKVEATLAEYQAALDEAGFQDVLAEAQAQYAAWKAN